MADVFAAALNCIDGRTHRPLIRWVKRHYKVDYLDLITQPGMVAFLADEDCSVEKVLKQIDVSIRNHGSVHIFIVGHYDCAGNLVDDKTQKGQVARAVKRIKYFRPKANVVGLWIDGRWQVNALI